MKLASARQVCLRGGSARYSQTEPATGFCSQGCRFLHPESEVRLSMAAEYMRNSQSVSLLKVDQKVAFTYRVARGLLNCLRRGRMVVASFEQACARDGDPFLVHDNRLSLLLLITTVVDQDTVSWLRVGGGL